MMLGRGPWFLVLAGLLASCSDDVDDHADVLRFDARDTTSDIYREAWGGDVAHEVEPQVDVVLFDQAPPPHDAAAEAWVDARADGQLTLCEDLAEQYGRSVRAALVCGSDDACGTLVCETVCCACEVYVDGSSLASSAARTLLEQWTARGCVGSLVCPTLRCPSPSGAVCSGEGRCVTLRDGPGDAGGP